MKVLTLLLIACGLQAQNGMTGLATATHPRIWWNDAARLTRAQAYYGTNPWTSGSNNIDHAALLAAHGLITSTSSELTAAKDTALAYTILLKCFQITAGAATDCGDDPMRYFGEITAEVYDWAYSAFSAGEAQLLRDRWLGATSGPTDPVHTAINCSVPAGSSTITCEPGTFLANMAGNNMVMFSAGGTNCPPGSTSGGIETRWPIATVVSDTVATLGTFYGTVNTSTPSSGCHLRIGGYVDITNLNDWGDITMPYSNYYWGFTRNNFMWPVAAYGENLYANNLLDSWATRWTDNLTFKAGTGNWTANSQLGGMWSEGTEYGLQSYLYQVMPLYVAPDYGRALPGETNWYKESLIFTLYNGTLTPTSDQNGHTYYQQFPWDDTQRNADPTSPEFVEGYPSGILAQSVISPLAQLFGSTNLGKYGRQFVNTISGTGIMPIPWLVDPLSSAASLSALPLDYYAPGVGMGFTKDTWGATGTQVKFLPTNDLSPHAQLYQGEFQIASNGYWMTKGFTNYSDSGTASAISCLYTGTTTPGVQGTTTCDVRYPPAHNTLSFVPSIATGCNVYPWTDSRSNEYFSAAPATLRLESQTNYYYQANDLTGGFYNGEIFSTDRMCQRNNPYADTVVRQLVYIKPLKTLIVLDRMKSGYNPQSGDTHPVQTASQLTKTIYIHVPVAPTISSNTATWDNSTERMKGWFFSNESSVAIANVDEGDFPGHVTGSNYYQQRLEVGAGGHAQTYMVSVLKVGPVSGFQDFTTATLTGTGPYTLTLNSAGGNALLTFDVGATPNGEALGYAASGTPSTSPLTTTVNVPVVSDSGVSWAGSTASGSTAGGSLKAGGKVIH